MTTKTKLPGGFYLMENRDFKGYCKKCRKELAAGDARYRHHFKGIWCPVCAAGGGTVPNEEQERVNKLVLGLLGLLIEELEVEMPEELSKEWDELMLAEAQDEEAKPEERKLTAEEKRRKERAEEEARRAAEQAAWEALPVSNRIERAYKKWETGKGVCRWSPPEEMIIEEDDELPGGITIKGVDYSFLEQNRKYFMMTGFHLQPTHHVQGDSRTLFLGHKYMKKSGEQG